MDIDYDDLVTTPRSRIAQVPVCRGHIGSRHSRSRERLLVSSDGQILYSESPLGRFRRFVDAGGGKLASSRVFRLLGWVHAGFVSESSVVHVRSDGAEVDQWLEVCVRSSSVADIYVVEATLLPKVAARAATAHTLCRAARSSDAAPQPLDSMLSLETPERS